MPQFYADFLNKPSALNNNQTLNRYWMENSFGKYGVELVPFGPYRLPEASYQYHISRFNDATADCPRIRRATARTAPRSSMRCVTRGTRPCPPPRGPRSTTSTTSPPAMTSRRRGRSSARCGFTGPDAVTDPFGPKAINPLHARGNWALTRYVPWTSWAAAGNIWPSASGVASTEAESSGMGVFAHELSHNLSLPDNYGNPFASPTSRSAGGMWDMMGRGSFNGPGGPHNRWQVPPRRAPRWARSTPCAQGRLGFVPTRDMLRVNRDGLAQSGLAVADVRRREVTPSREPPASGSGSRPGETARAGRTRTRL